MEAVVSQLAGGLRKKVYVRWGINKPLDAFCKPGDLPDGRKYRCKRCEAQRVKLYTARKAAE